MLVKPIIVAGVEIESTIADFSTGVMSPISHLGVSLHIIYFCTSSRNRTHPFRFGAGIACLGTFRCICSDKEIRTLIVTGLEAVASLSAISEYISKYGLQALFWCKSRIDKNLRQRIWSVLDILTFVLPVGFEPTMSFDAGFTDRRPST